MSCPRGSTHAAPRATRCAECSGRLAHDQRYCLRCGARRGPLPLRIGVTIGEIHEQGRARPSAGTDARRRRGLARGRQARHRDRPGRAATRQPGGRRPLGGGGDPADARVRVRGRLRDRRRRRREPGQGDRRGRLPRTGRHHDGGLHRGSAAESAARRGRRRAGGGRVPSAPAAAAPRSSRRSPSALPRRPSPPPPARPRPPRRRPACSDCPRSSTSGRSCSPIRAMSSRSPRPRAIRTWRQAAPPGRADHRLLRRRRVAAGQRHRADQRPGTDPADARPTAPCSPTSRRGRWGSSLRSRAPGCLYPSTALTLADQLDTPASAWRAYIQGIGQTRSAAQSTTSSTSTSPRARPRRQAPPPRPGPGDNDHYRRSAHFELPVATTATTTTRAQHDDHELHVPPAVHPGQDLPASGDRRRRSVNQAASGGRPVRHLAQPVRLLPLAAAGPAVRRR